tara:strand:- start:3993 stop:8324 length:4332 start_codon:yes stop_codon:yes gene_type:complete
MRERNYILMKFFLRTLLFFSFTYCSFQLSAQLVLPTFEAPVPLEALNSEAEESAPIPFMDGNKIYFVRTYVDGTAKQIRQGQDIWSSERIDGNWNFAESLFDEVNDIGNNAVIGTSLDGNKVYIFNSVQSRRKKARGIAFTEKNVDGEWSKLKKIELKGLEIGEGYYSFFINPTENILLISMPPNPSTLDEDLFVSLKQADGTWGEVINLGTTINTSNYEISPYIAEDGKTLFFSSNGHVGMGSADIFVAYRLDDSWTNWTKPENLGEPINSVGFDAYFIISNTNEVYFSSNRESTYGDLYSTKIIKPLQFIDDTVKELAKEPVLKKITGQFYNEGLPVENVTLEILDEVGEIVDVVVTDEDGGFNYSKLDPDKTYVIRIAEEDKSEFGEGKIYFVDDEGQKTGRFVSNKDGNFAEKGQPFNKQVFQGVYKYEALPVAKAQLIVVDENGFAMDTIFTDDEGKFNYDGLADGEEFNIIPLETQGKDIEEMDLMVSDGKGEKLISMPITPELIAMKSMIDVGGGAPEPIMIKSQFTLQGLPAENITLEVYDARGMLVDEVVTDEYGMFSYKKLNPQEIYMIKVVAEDFAELSEGSLYFVDDEGNKKGKFFKDQEGNFKEEGEIQVKEVFKGVYTYKKLPVAQATLIVLDESGFPMDTIVTDEFGNFNYEALSKDETFSIIPVETESKDLEDIEMAVADESGQVMNIPPVTQEMVAKMPLKPLEKEAFKLEPITVHSQFTMKGLPVENVKLEIYDEEGVLVDEVVTDAYGNFSYTKLNPDKNYVIKISEDDIADFIGGTVFFLDKDGNKEFKYQEEEEGTYKEKLTAERLETIQGVFNYEAKPVNNAAIGIMDASGFILDTVYTDENGNFKYEGAINSKDYSAVVMEAENIDQENLDFYLKDQTGKKIEGSEAKQGLMAKKPMVSLLDKSVVFSQMTLKGLPADNVKLEIYDEEGVLVDEVVTDAYGMFSYIKLDPEKNYVVKIAEEDVEDFSSGKVYFVDQEGNKVKRYEKDGQAKFVEFALEKPKEKVRGYYTYQNKSEEKIALGVFDENGFLLDTVYTAADGSFEFEGLDSNEAFSVVVMESEKLNRKDLEIFITDETGKKIKSEPILEGLMVRKPFVNIVDKTVVRGQFLYEGLPVENVVLEIYDEDGTFIDEVVTDSYGSFVYKKLDLDKHYVVKIPMRDVETLEKSQVYFTDELGNKTGRFTEIKEGEFAERVDDSNKERLQGIYKYDDKPVKNSGLIIIDENGVPLDTFFTDDGGKFEFFVIDSEEEFSIFPMHAENVHLDKIDLYLTDNAGDRIKTLIVQKPKKEMLQTKDSGLAKRKSESSASYESSQDNNVYIYFKFNQYILSTNDKRILDLVIDVLVSYEDATVNLIGHTDDIGSLEINYRFGESRARSARRYLTQNGIDNHRITIKSMGETKPIASNETEEGRAKNRRVEVVVN